jgi:hypothetical protein
MIAGINKGLATRVDQEVSDALFLRRNAGWKPEDLGYPAGDYVLIDLMRMID